MSEAKKKFISYRCKSLVNKKILVQMVMTKVSFLGGN